MRILADIQIAQPLHRAGQLQPWLRLGQHTHGQAGGTGGDLTGEPGRRVAVVVPDPPGRQLVLAGQEIDAATYVLDAGDGRVEISALSMGNPHAVQVVADIERAPVAAQGPLIERHPRFPQRVNAGYMQVVGRRRILLRVHERGAGETLACGTGACAAVVAGIQRGLLDREVAVTTRGGDLGISWAGEGRPVMMTGPAVTVFEGEMELKGA